MIEKLCSVIFGLFNSEDLSDYLVILYSALLHEAGVLSKGLDGAQYSHYTARALAGTARWSPKTVHTSYGELAIPVFEDKGLKKLIGVVFVACFDNDSKAILNVLKLAIASNGLSIPVPNLKLGIGHC